MRWGGGGWGWRSNAQAKGLVNGPALVPASEGGVFTEVGDLRFDGSDCLDLTGRQVQAMKELIYDKTIKPHLLIHRSPCIIFLPQNFPFLSLILII